MPNREAGRALDAEIDRVVMGVERCAFEGTGRREIREGTLSEFCVRCGQPHGSHAAAPRYSTHIAAAWEVVEKLYAERWYFSLELTADSTWVAGVGRNGKAEEPTAPLAICLAALAAVEASDA